MKIKHFYLMIFFFLSPCYSFQDIEKFYSIPFLRDYKAVQTALKDAGFKRIIFKTSDNLKLTGFFLARPHARCNVVVCAGWFPGRKEGMATFYALLPDYCNILFFDARARGESEGNFFWNVWRYGTDEYKDISAAISWINQHNQLPIIIGGTCSGVFNAVHAILFYLREENVFESCRIKGLFFDSGWGSVMTMSQSSAIANIKKFLTKIAFLLYGRKKHITEQPLYSLSCSALTICFKVIHRFCIRPFILPYEDTTNLFDKIHRINIPILFIHSRDDSHAAFANVRKLAALAPNKQCWWIEKSSHAKHHLIHKELYKKKLIAFIDNVIQ